MDLVAVSHARSFLFCPADAERRLQSALSSDADVVVADLEDGVAPASKEAARRSLAELAERPNHGPILMARVNGVGSGALAQDLGVARTAGVAAVMLPKATPGGVAEAAAAGFPVIALVETAAGVLSAAEIARHPAVIALALGGADLAVELRLEERRDGLELIVARGWLVIASAAAGLRPPVDVVHLDVADADGLREQAHLARSLGMGGKLCIHPRQLAVVHEVFTPSADAIEHARRLVSAYEEGLRRGDGVGLLDGRLVDAPVADRAREILNQAQGVE